MTDSFCQDCVTANGDCVAPQWTIDHVRGPVTACPPGSSRNYYQNGAWQHRISGTSNNADYLNLHLSDTVVDPQNITRYRVNTVEPVHASAMALATGSIHMPGARYTTAGSASETGIAELVPGSMRSLHQEQMNRAQETRDTQPFCMSGEQNCGMQGRTTAGPWGDGCVRRPETCAGAYAIGRSVDGPEAHQMLKRSALAATLAGGRAPRVGGTYGNSHQSVAMSGFLEQADRVGASSQQFSLNAPQLRELKKQPYSLGPNTMRASDAVMNSRIALGKTPFQFALGSADYKELMSEPYSRPLPGRSVPHIIPNSQTYIQSLQ